MMFYPPRPVVRRAPRRLPQRRWTKLEDYVDPKAHNDAGVVISHACDRAYFNREGKILPP